jgi:lysozyme
MNTDLLRKLLMQHEGMRLKPYWDTAEPPKLTIGVGYNISGRGPPQGHTIEALRDQGISQEFALQLLDDDIKTVVEHASTFDWFPYISNIRQTVVCDMIFNLGLNKFKEFKKFIAAIDAADWRLASIEMLNSVWAHQVGERAIMLSRMMERDVV